MQISELSKRESNSAVLTLKSVHTKVYPYKKHTSTSVGKSSFFKGKKFMLQDPAQ